MNNNIGLRGRLFAGFGAMMIIFLIATSVVLFKIKESQTVADRVIRVVLPIYDSYHDLAANIYIAQASIKTWMSTHDEDSKKELIRTWVNVDKINDKLNSYSEVISPQERVNLKEIGSLISQLKSLEMKVINNPAETVSYATEIKPLVNDILTRLDGALTSDGMREGGMLTAYYKRLGAGANDIISHMNTLQYIEYVFLALVLIISIFITLYTSHSILQYINVFRKQSKRVAAGDLTHRVTINTRDEMGLLGEDLNAMTEGLSTITKQISEACHNMVSMLSEVKHAVDSQSAGASEQASSINQITASLEEIEKSSMQTIEKAKALGEVAERTRAKGELGLQAVEQSVNGMKVVRDKVQTISETILELSNQTQQVGEITSVVNMLAQQSKMLALNASIEAAKAGEAGKGFAVVAAEVKNLAEQSEQSTAQVQKILEDIRHATEKAVLAMEEGTRGVDVGTELVEQTGEIVRSLSDVIHEATVASQQIEAAIRQEGIGIEQITAGMNEINQVTSSSVEGVRQTTEAIDNLGSIATTLKKYTDTYKV